MKRYLISALLGLFLIGNAHAQMAAPDQHAMKNGQGAYTNKANTFLQNQTWKGTGNAVGTITSGTWSGGVIGSTVGGAGSVNGALKANGSGTVSQAACADLSNGAASCSTDTTNATNISSGTLGAGRLPNPSASTLGGIESIAAVSHNFLTSISTAGVPAQAQPACADLSNAATSCSTDATNATNISAGTLAAARGGTGVSNTATLTLGSSNVNLATLGTGIVKNTVTTGALTDATSTDIIGLFTGCSGSQYLGADGACHTAAGAGTMTSLTCGTGLTCTSTNPITTSGTVAEDTYTVAVKTVVGMNIGGL